MFEPKPSFQLLGVSSLCQNGTDKILRLRARLGLN